MNRTQALELLQRYRYFPGTNVFEAKPLNYPLFHLLECFTKDNWNISFVHGNHVSSRIHNFEVEELGDNIKKGKHSLWTYVARNRSLHNTMLAYVQEDLYCRYVGRCNPLKASHTSWTFIPYNKVRGEPRFNGKIGKYTNLYLLEIDLDIVDIKGKWNDDVPWHYLQQTIDWKPYTDRINWQDDLNVVNERPESPLRENFNRIRQEEPREEIDESRIQFGADNRMEMRPGRIEVRDGE